MRLQDNTEMQAEIMQAYENRQHEFAVQALVQHLQAAAERKEGERAEG